MATVNKDFRVKNGLIVEGASGTIDGSNILTEASTEFLQDTVGAMVTGNSESGITVSYDDTSGKLDFSVVDSNTTYSISAENVTGGADVRLTGSDASTDNVSVIGDGATTVTRTDENTITISSTDSNTTYDLETSGTSTATISLSGSDSSSDSFTITGSGATTVSHSAGAITISSTDNNTVTNAFTTISTPSGSSPVADSTSDTLTLTAGSGISITGNSTTDSIEFVNTGVTSISGTSNEIQVSGSTGSITIGLPDDVTVGGDLVVTGDLTVNGTTTTLNTNELSIEDNAITLNSNVTGTPTLDAGIEVERGTYTNAKIYWNETANKWYVATPGDSSGASTDTAIALSGEFTADAYSTVSDGTNTASASGADTLTFSADPGLLVSVDGASDTVTYSLDATAMATLGAVQFPESTIGSAGVTSSGTSATIDQFLVSDYSSAKYVIQAKNASGDIEVTELLVTVDGSNNVYLTEYANVYSNASLGEFTATHSTGIILVQATSTSSGVVFKASKTYIEA